MTCSTTKGGKRGGEKTLGGITVGHRGKNDGNLHGRSLLQEGKSRERGRCSNGVVGEREHVRRFKEVAQYGRH